MPRISKQRIRSFIEEQKYPDEVSYQEISDHFGRDRDYMRATYDTIMTDLRRGQRVQAPGRVNPFFANRSRVVNEARRLGIEVGNTNRLTRQNLTRLQSLIETKKQNIRRNAYQFTNIQRRTLNRFQVFNTEFKMNENRMVDLLDDFDPLQLNESFVNSFQRFIQRSVSNLNLRPTSMISITIEHPNWTEPKFVSTNLQNIDSIASRVLSRIQSSGDERISECSFQIVVSNRPSRVGARSRLISESQISTKHGIIQTEGRFNTCFFECVVLGLIHYKYTLLLDTLHTRRHELIPLSPNYNGERIGKPKYNWNNVVLSSRKNHVRNEIVNALLGYLIELFQHCNFMDVYDEEGFDLLKISKIEEALYIKIHIWDIHGYWSYQSKTNEQIEPMFFLKNGDHLDYIKSMKSILNNDYFCSKCLKGYDKEIYHSVCKGLCKLCKSSDCDSKDDLYTKRIQKYPEIQKLPVEVNHHILSYLYGEVKCKDCFQIFPTMKCYENHIKNQASIRDLCIKKKFCKDCGLRATDKHRCGKSQCKNCFEYMDVDTHDTHKCYMMKTKFKKPIDDASIYVWDVETDSTDIHDILCVAVYHYLTGEHWILNTIEQFMEFCFHPDRKGSTFIAHNASRYDTQFIKKFYITHPVYKIKKPVVRGNKILLMEGMNRTRFIDSYCLFPEPLRNFTSIFNDIPKELAKGHFPYKFSTRENMNYVGPIPDIEMFDFETIYKKEKDYKEAVKWYDEYKEQVGNNYNIYEEMVKYCINDCILLCEGLKRYRTILREITMDENENYCDPLSYITIASIAKSIYTTKFMKRKTIGIQKTAKIHTFKLKKEWLDFIQVPVRSFKVGNYSVDGYDEKSNTVYQFNGCHFHGCNICYKAEQYTKSLDCKYGKLYDKWIEKETYLKNQGFTIITMWEHTWNEMKKTNQVVMDFIKQYSYKDTPIELKVLGGRTEVFKHLYRCLPNERIRYMDFTSLYPTINFGRKRGIQSTTKDKYENLYYPIGHPTIHKQNTFQGWTVEENHEYIRNTYGFIKCKVVCPDNLYIPVLPNNTNGKLMFDLNDVEYDTYFIDELQLAIENGYKILEIYEVQEFETSDSLFRDYVKMFLKIKTESSGFPSNVNTEENKQIYIQHFKTEMDIELEYDKIERNNGMRAVSKLFLNSLWGKFGQKSNEYTDVKYCRTIEEYHSIIFNEKYEVSYIHIIDTTCIEVQYKNKSINSEDRYDNNLPIACATTSMARMRLYEALKVIGKNILYCDTDSVIYVEDIHNPIDLVCGDLLGDFTNELDVGDYITNFVALAPKSYAYTTKNGKVICKVKGFTLNIKNQKNINFDSIEKLILGEKDELKISNTQFVINKNGGITSVFQEKKLKNQEKEHKRLVLNPIFNDDGSIHYIDTVPFRTF